MLLRAVLPPLLSQAFFLSLSKHRGDNIKTKTKMMKLNPYNDTKTMKKIPRLENLK